MKLCPTVLGLIALFAGLGNALPTWPSSIDELEDVMFLNTGYKNRGFAAHITPCSLSEFGVGRQTAAEWLRVGFHDMANTNVFFEPHGGIDASLMFELGTGDNVGTGFTTSLNTYGGLYNSQLSVADLIALGVAQSVRGCSGPVVPMRGGRPDATVAGSSGLTPQPQNARGTFINQFARMGFNTTEMIQMTACGHTIGGVHAANFPTIVAPGTAPNDYQLFDETLTFDNQVVVRYLNGPDTDPLSLGISVASGRNSDATVFGADKNVTVKAMENVATFNSMCSTILQKMIEVVPPTVTLSDIIQPYEVKPSGVQLTLLSGGTQLTFAGDIRVRTTTRSVSGVQLVYKDRTGASGGTISTTVSGTANGYDDSFSFYGFSATIPASTSISSFTVVVTYTSGGVTTYDNNGVGYLIQDSVIVQTPQSCLNNGNLTVVAAVRSGTAAPSLIVTQKIARTNGIPVPVLSESTVSMVKGTTIGLYDIYSTSFTISSAVGAKYDVTSGTLSDSFNDVSSLGTTCAAMGTTPTTSTSSSAVPSSTSSRTSSVTATPTLGHKAVVGTYSFQGCYTEGNGVRALTGASTVDYTGMTSEKCAAFCSGFTYWGIEYGGECYCGNTLAASSTLAPLSDCYFVCQGDNYEYCGAGNRLELYKLTSAASSSSLSATSTISSTISSVSSSTSSSGSVTPSSSLSQTPTSASSSKISTTTSAAPTLRIVKNAGLYNYMGCFTEATGVRALSAASFSTDTNTVESCVAACSPYLYAGVEYGRECWCGDSFGTGSALVADSDCYFTCAGDQYEYCGAGNRLNVYIRNGTTASGRSVSSSSTSVVYTSSSKPLSSTSISTLRSSSSVLSSSARLSSSTSTSIRSSSPSSSSRSTSSSSSSIRSSSSSRTTSQTTSSQRPSSTSPSTSSPSSTLSTSTIKPSSTSTTTTQPPTQTGPSLKSNIGNWTYYGCQTEATSSRALSSISMYDYTSMTLELCASTCAGYKYFGVEYHGECYCGNSFNAGSVSAPNSECSFTCPGDASEYCGAGNRLTSYVWSP